MFIWQSYSLNNALKRVFFWGYAISKKGLGMFWGQTEKGLNMCLLYHMTLTFDLGQVEVKYKLTKNKAYNMFLNQKRLNILNHMTLTFDFYI